MAKSVKKKRQADDSSEGKKKSNGLLIGLIGGGGVLLLLCLCGGGAIGGYFLLGKRGDTDPGPGSVKKAGKKRDINVLLHPEKADLANDPKWLDNPDLKKLLPGRWRAMGTHYDFRNDGTMERVGLFPEKGTYKIIDAETVEISSMPIPKLAITKDVVRTSICLVSDDEMAMFTRSRLRDAKPNDYSLDGPFYRMRDDGTGLGRTKFVDPLIEKVKSGNPADRANALGTLGLLGPDAWPAVPELVRILDNKGPDVGMAFGTLQKIGPKAKDAVPALRKYINDKQQARSAIMVLGEIGPDAKDAIPDLRRLLPNSEAEGALRKIDPKAKF